MRCHEARQRINESDQAQFDPDRDKELLEHLRLCYKCAELSETAILLNRDLKAGGACDTEGGLSFPNLKARIEKKIDSGVLQQNKELSLMGKLINSVTKRPRLGLSLGVAVVLLAFLTLVPFKFERTIGYEVAIAGVDKDLALDTEKVQMLFVKLGLDDAKFDVSDCEVTCNMKITHLKSENDARIIIAAFDELGNCTLEEINEIQGEHSVSLLWYVKEGNDVKFGDAEDGTVNALDITSFFDDVDGKTKVYVSQVVSKLSSECGDSFNIWVSKDEDGGDDLIIIDGADSHTVICLDSLSLASHAGTDQVWNLCEDNQMTKIKFLSKGNGDSKFVISTPNGDINIFDFDEENIAEKLKELGIDIQILGDFEGSGHTAFFVGDGKTYGEETGEVVEESISPSATKFTNQLPEEYELQQNYPNPFNPATTIVYSLPRAELVVLEIYNSNGQKVRTLVDEVMSAGDHSIIWDATNDNNIKVATGIYLYKLTAGDFVDSKKMSLVK